MLKRLTDRIYFMPQRRETDRPLLGLICGDKYSLIVDSGGSPQHAREFLSEVDSLDVPPVKYLIITHWHWDHVFGIKEMSFTTIGHEKTKEKLEELKSMKWDDDSLEKYLQEGIFNEFTINCIKEEIPKSERDEFTLGDIDIAFKGSMKIDLGGVTCIIDELGGSHTEDSIIVYIPEEKVTFLGDCVYGTRYKGEYGYTKETLFPMIDKIQKYDAKYYLISHEDIHDKNGIDELWNKLKSAERVVGKGDSTEEATKSFYEEFSREPSEEEEFYISCFANVNKVLEEDSHK